ncbi:MAG: hypothetical protein DGJ47_000913 [Rickettsiaceae bacterium]
MNKLAYQFGIGVNKDITENFSVDFAAKLQIIKDLSLVYSIFDPIENKLVGPQSVKKSFGVGEFTVGLTYKIPIK